MNSTIFTAHCQAWLDDLTRLHVTHGLCRPEIKKWHRLTMTTCPLPGDFTDLLIIPQFLLEAVQAGTVEEESVPGRIIKRAEGIPLMSMLRSECYRLGLSALAEQLQLLIRQYPQPGIRESLTLLCWCELVGGIDLGAWYALHLPLPHTLKKWISTRQKKFSCLTALTKEYIRISKPL
ncbi:TPA: secretoglobin family protein [Citrobacter farmeri]|uniref:Secretoglobin family protein n=1 Tax=Citrobacter farmeri TaxID=67824 RepID=A0A8H9NUZ6_9ENTR|nr:MULTISPECIES: secretoglobin family protein [Enterobacteriaceae]HCC6093544.1 secretoglobin family protein [Citrobacter freundii]EFC1677785.1 secretoglobin family protein [Escherichia coli]EIH8471008.1 secretoglobin family protein [Escherichia coli]EIO6349842.1 secretoglobin family protein [Escherichia coli]EJD3658282.1 secretoglobin family protein [Escherichia coli]